ncbi:hypothetical protein Tco_0109734 [Tanacetum coccineum]
MYCMKIFQIGEKYLSFRGEEFTCSVDVRDALSLSANPNVANPALTVPFGGKGTSEVLSAKCTSSNAKLTLDAAVSVCSVCCGGESVDVDPDGDCVEDMIVVRLEFLKMV